MSQLLVTELKDIVARIKGAAAHEKAALQAQFGERLKHLAPLLKEEGEALLKEALTATAEAVVQKAEEKIAEKAPPPK